jgi:hypothetical protein
LELKRTTLAFAVALGLPENNGAANEIWGWAKAYAAPAPNKCANLRRDIDPNRVMAGPPISEAKFAALSVIVHHRPNLFGWQGQLVKGNAGARTSGKRISH